MIYRPCNALVLCQPRIDACAQDKQAALHRGHVGHVQLHTGNRIGLLQRQAVVRDNINALDVRKHQRVCLVCKTCLAGIRVKHPQLVVKVAGIDIFTGLSIRSIVAGGQIDLVARLVIGHGGIADYAHALAALACAVAHAVFGNGLERQTAGRNVIQRPLVEVDIVGGFGIACAEVHAVEIAILVDGHGVQRLVAVVVHNIAFRNARRVNRHVCNLGNCAGRRIQTVELRAVFHRASGFTVRHAVRDLAVLGDKVDHLILVVIGHVSHKLIIRHFGVVGNLYAG